jgi:N,N'-diacetylchitobiose phosphorylase
MQYGHFDDQAREYVIDRPDTPRSWSNYLGSTEYGAITTNNAGGYSFFRSAALGRITRLRFNAIPLDQPGRYFYLRDADSGDFWSASWQPVGKPLDQYESVCRHGTAYTVISSRYSGIATEATYFVPLGQEFEYWLLSVTNESDRPRTLDVFTYVEFASEWNSVEDLVDIQYSLAVMRCGVVDGIIDHIICNDLPLMAVGRLRQPLHTFLGVTGAEIVGFDTDREQFIGPYHTYANPQVVEAGRCTGSLAYGDNGCGVLQLQLTLAPGETRELVVVQGMGQAAVEGQRIRAEFGTPARARDELKQLKAYWHSRLGALTVHTPDPAFDSMMNMWAPYNALICYSWSRAASLIYSGERDGLGFRDTVQDLQGVFAAVPDEARARLELMLTGQFSTGGAKPVVRPFDHTPGQEALPADGEYRSDDCLWFFNTVPAYVKETGDLGFFAKVLPYADAGAGTVLDHLKRALQFSLDYRGAHGLPAALIADWNDCLGLGRHGESVFVAFQLRFALVVYADICTRLGYVNEVAWAQEHLATLDAAIQTHCWDGAWFVRAFRECGTALGSAPNTQGRIFLEPQPWAVISGAATPAQACQAMDSVYTELFTAHGLRICTPGFTRYDNTAAANILGNPGIKENGGIFCHPQGWAIIAECLLGRGDRAYEYLRAYLPAAYNARAEVREVEPYVYAQSAHGPQSPKFGVSRLPWLTGTVAWSYVAATQHVLGIQPDYDGLRIVPCLPSAWDEIHVTRRFRDCDFAITIRNRGMGTGVSRLVVNGEELPGDLIPTAKFLTHNTVAVEIGVARIPAVPAGKA